MKLIRLLCISLLLIYIPGCKKDGIFSKDNKVSPHDFLSADNYEQLIIEIRYVSGYSLSSSTIDNLVSFLSQRLNKPLGISVEENSVPSPAKSSYTLDDIRDIEDTYRTMNANGKTITLYIFVADGDYAGNSGGYKTLGITYDNSSVVLFEKTIRDLSGGIGEPSTTTLETTVTNHEFGHILGLVNNGSDMQTNHEDAANAHHCNNQNCLMYYAVETSDVISSFIGNTIPELDANCINDLIANGGKY